MNVEEIPGKIRESVDAVRLGLADLRTQLLAKRVVVEIHDHGLRGVVVARQGELIEVPLPSGSCREGEPLAAEAIGDLVGDLFLELGLAGAKVSACLPLQASRWRVVRWPQDAMPENGRTELRFRLPDLGLPWSLNDAYLEVASLPGTPARSLVVAAPQRVVDGWVEVFELAGVQLQRLLPAQACEWQMLTALGPHPAGDDEEQWFLELQPERSRLWVVAGGVPWADWTLPGQRGSAGLEPQLQEALLRCRRFWQQHRGGQTAAQSWWLYGADTAIAAAEADLRHLCQPASLGLWQPAGLGTRLDLRLAGLKLCMGWS